MKDPEIKIVRKMSEEQKKLLFFAPIGIIVLLVCGYILFNDGPKSSKTSVANTKSEWELPGDSQKELPNSSLKISDQLGKHNNALNKANNGDFFENLDNIHSNELIKEDKTGSNSDSMYLELQNQLKALENTKSTQVAQTNYSGSRSQRSNNNQKTEEELDEHFINKVSENYDDFFNTNPEVVKREIVEKVSKTDLSIEAVIHNDQIITNNSRVKLRLSKSAVINGQKLSKNTFIYGFAKFTRNRVLLSINKIDQQNVNLVAYDKEDSNLGIYIEGANLIGDASDESVDDVVDEVDSQNRTVNTIRNIIKKKNKTSKIELLNNYELVLKVKN